MGRSVCRSGLPDISGCRMLVERIDGKVMARNSFWRRYGIHPGARWGRRESAVRGDHRDLKGRQRSAGTFSSRRRADRAWQRAEGKVAQGYLGEPGRGRQTFRDYVEKTWLPNHEIEASTRQSYT